MKLLTLLIDSSLQIVIFLLSFYYKNTLTSEDYDIFDWENILPTELHLSRESSATWRIVSVLNSDSFRIEICKHFSPNLFIVDLFFPGCFLFLRVSPKQYFTLAAAVPSVAAADSSFSNTGKNGLIAPNPSRTANCTLLRGLSSSSKRPLL